MTFQRYLYFKTVMAKNYQVFYSHIGQQYSIWVQAQILRYFGQNWSRVAMRETTPMRQMTLSHGVDLKSKKSFKLSLPSRSNWSIQIRSCLYLLELLKKYETKFGTEFKFIRGWLNRRMKTDFKSGSPFCKKKLLQLSKTYHFYILYRNVIYHFIRCSQADSLTCADRNNIHSELSCTPYWRFRLWLKLCFRTRFWYQQPAEK